MELVLQGHTLGAYYVPNTVLNTLHILTHVTLKTMPLVGFCYYSQGENEETEAKRGREICLQSPR